MKTLFAFGSGMFCGMLLIAAVYLYVPGVKEGWEKIYNS